MEKTFSLLGLLMSLTAFGQDHCVKHNMVLFGEQEVFASHIVYKVPHNYQVVMKVTFSDDVKKKYLSARQQNPGKLMILLLDPTDISKINIPKDLSATLLVEDESGTRTEIASKIRISREDYQVLFFDEVPMPSEPASHTANHP